MKMEYAENNLDSIINMLQTIKKDKGGNLPIFIKFGTELLHLTSCAVMGEDNMLGVVLGANTKSFKLEIGSNETH